MKKLPSKVHQFFHARLFSTMLAIALSCFVIASPQTYAGERLVKKQAEKMQQAITQVNINRAGIKDLMHLKGVGEKKAIAIVKYRNDHGKYRSVEQLAKVKGISLAIIEKNRAMITL